MKFICANARKLPAVDFACVISICDTVEIFVQRSLVIGSAVFVVISELSLEIDTTSAVFERRNRTI